MVARGLNARPYRPGGFILHPGFVAVVLIGVPVWLGLFFVGESTRGVVAVVVAVLLVVLGLWLGWFFFLWTVVEAIGMTLWRYDRDERKRRRDRRGRPRTTVKTRYIYFVVFAPALLAAVILGFGFGYLAGGVFWGIYTAVATLACVTYVEFFVFPRTR